MRFSLILLVMLLLVLLFFSGCSVRVTVPAEVKLPRTVQLLTHGQHSSILLTTADQRRWRYAYGDWAWYVDNDQGVFSGVRALLLPSNAAFGRQLLAAEQPDEWLERTVGVGIGKAWVFQVEAARVDALLARLEQQFNQPGTVPYYSAGRHLAFVPHPHPYSFSHNSNHQVADWLRALGVDVKGSPALGNWQVKESVAAK